jgi:hypothetical protein
MKISSQPAVESALLSVLVVVLTLLTDGTALPSAFYLRVSK